jgi:hypothetical protein
VLERLAQVSRSVHPVGVNGGQRRCVLTSVSIWSEVNRKPSEAVSIPSKMKRHVDDTLAELGDDTARKLFDDRRV